jgi:hypothetical protein
MTGKNSPMAHTTIDVIWVHMGQFLGFTYPAVGIFIWYCLLSCHSPVICSFPWSSKPHEQGLAVVV